MIHNYHNIYQVTKHTFRPSNSLLIQPGAESGQYMTQGDTLQHYIAKAKHKASKQGGYKKLSAPHAGISHPVTGEEMMHQPMSHTGHR